LGFPIIPLSVVAFPSRVLQFFFKDLEFFNYESFLSLKVYKEKLNERNEKLEK